MWIKICGNTNLEDALFAANAGADAVGFVFADSPRQVSAEQVGTITPHLPSTVEAIGVFAEAAFETIVHAIRVGHLTGVQLHGTPDQRLETRLRAHFGPALKILRVLHYTSQLEAELAAARHDQGIDGILIDSRTAASIGGTGIRFDWEAARSGIAAAHFRVIVAGGLNPENVAEAIRTLHPWGVDVSSGVESAPGKKDLDKVKSFIQAARAAAGNAPIS